jgi:PPM family protein phosphatase
VIGFANFEYAALTDVGVRRSHNQDSHVVMPAGDAELWERRGHVFLVADGMGAHAVGELASKLAVDGIPHIYSKYADEGPVTALRKAFVETNVVIHTRGQQNKEFEGMGTTGTALVLRPEGAWIGHVGDSRVYRVRDGVIEQLSFDHSLVWELARRQNVDPRELQSSIPSNVIVRSLGPERDVQVDVEGPHPLRDGDIFVLCSDGLSGPVSDREIGAVVSALPPQEACRFLVDLANLNKGPDNITVIVVRVGSVGEAPQERPADSWPEPRRSARAPLRGQDLWPSLALALGIVFGVSAILLTYADLPGRLGVFLLAALAVAAGLGGLFIQNLRPKKETIEDGTRPVQAYQRTPCAIELSLVQQLAKAEATLRGRIRENGWEADWAICEQHQELARRYQDEGNLVKSFSEYCRATTLLAEVVHRQRGKEESFQPVWDRGPVGKPGA